MDTEGRTIPKEGKLTKTLFLTTLISALGSSVQYGYNFSVINHVSEAMKSFYNETYRYRNGISIDSSLLMFQWGLTVSFFPLGGLLGSLLVGPLADSCGRKGALLANNVLAITSAILMGSSTAMRSHEFIIFARLIIGTCTGVAFSVVPMYVTELAPTNLRETLGMVAHLFILFGGLLAILFSLPQILGTPKGWPILLSLVGLPALFQIIALPFCPESPRYLLIQRKDEEKARQALKKLRGQDDVEEEMEELRQEDATEKSEKDMDVFKFLQSEDQRWNLITAVVLMGGQQLSGINAAQHYMERIFTSTRIGAAIVPYITMTIYILLLFTLVLALYVVESFGLKNLLLTGFGICSITCILLTMSLELQKTVLWLSYFSATFVSLFLIGQCIGPDSVANVMISELFLQSSRSSAFVVTGYVHWLCRFLIAVVYLHVETYLEPYSFLFFWPLCVVSFIYLSKMIPDTRNKTFLETQRLVALQTARRILIKELMVASDS
nr:solute carrier family 2, facilitated glucose transporter member 5-like [Pogona vitticeps]